MKKEREIDAHRYANDFEELSLDVVNLIFQTEHDTREIILSDTTQKTRDKGVDAFIILRVGTSYYTYTVEAKLRNFTTLSLKDFASSILYCLINTSYRHFVVTNVRFSDEAVRVINRLNRNKYKKIELIDGEKLQQIINEHLIHFSKYPDELIKFIQAQTFLPIVYSLQTNSVRINESFIIKVDSREKYLRKIEDYIEKGYKLFLITGSFGVGKHTLIKECMENLNSDIICQEIDLSIVRTPKLLIWELLKFLFGIEMEELFESVDDKKENNIGHLADFQVFPYSNKELIYALNVLLDKNTDSYEDTIYYMNLLCGNIIEQYFSNSTIAFSIVNLHCATQEMINFILDFLNCLIKNKFVILINLLYPQIQGEIRYLTLEQWYNYIHLLKNFRTEKLPVIIPLENYKEDEAKFVIEQYLPIHSLSTEYKQKFIEYFGTNPHDMYIALSIIKKKKLYTEKALRQIIDQTLPQMLEEMIYINIHKLNFPASDICRELLTFLVVMEGSLPYCVFDYITEKYVINDFSFLEEIGLFKFQNDYLTLKQGISLEIIKKYTNPLQEKMCAGWLFDHIHETGLDSVRKAYFKYKFLYLKSPAKVVDNTLNVTGYLKRNQAYDLAISVTNMCYNFYKIKHETKQYFIYVVEYLELLSNINPYNSQDISILIKEVSELRLELESFHQTDLEIINANIKFAFILYKKEKMNYNYQACEEYINYILNYENILEDKSYFIKAYIYKALIKKEQGLRNKFIINILQALRKYPDSKEIKIAYYANLAAMYKTKHLDISIKLLSLIMNIAQGDITIRGSLWTEIDLLQYRCFMGSAKYDEIKIIRKKAERIASTNNLARSFNVEGYFYLKQFNMLNAKECAETSVAMSLTAGESKLYFLFTLNLISILRLMKLGYKNYFYDALRWFQRHETEIIKRVKNNRNRQDDHMFSAIINLIILSQEIKISLNKISSDETIINLMQLSCSKLLKLVPDYYKFCNSIFILY